MAGKIIGLSGLGLTQMAFWVLIGLAISAKFAITLIPLDGALLLFVYFLLGYLLYAAIFVAAGAPVSTEQEAQQITSYLVMILIIPMVFFLHGYSESGIDAGQGAHLRSAPDAVDDGDADSDSDAVVSGTRTLDRRSGRIGLRRDVGGRQDLPDDHFAVWKASGHQGTDRTHTCSLNRSIR